MGLKEFGIYFDTPGAIYYPGSTILGKVILTLDAPKNTRGIHITFTGAADTSWSSRKQVHVHADHSRAYENITDQHIHLTGHEDYFKIHYYLFGSSSGDQTQLPAGTHVYPFQCVLPPNLPSSFESHYGRIRYTIKAVVDRPWKFDHETKAAFTVISTLDLNLLPHASGPIRLEKTKRFGCCCCVSPPLTLNVDCPAKGYVPGQSIPIRLNIENESGVEIEKVKMSLEKIVCYKVTTPRNEIKKESFKVTEAVTGSVKQRETVQYEKILEIPSIPPSNLHNCGIIDIEYQLNIEAVAVGCCRRNLVLSAPIYIGTVPLYSMNNLQNTAYSGPSPSAPLPELSSNQPAESSAHYPNYAPPSYEESMFRTSWLREPGESEYVIGSDIGFAPKYPVYKS